MIWSLADNCCSQAMNAEIADDLVPHPLLTDTSHVRAEMVEMVEMAETTETEMTGVA